jgi:hypothetical protein
MVDAANADPGDIAATNPATRHNLFAVARMLVSFVIVPPASFVIPGCSLAPVSRTGSRRRQ